MFRLYIAALIISLLGACSPVTVEDYRNYKPALQPETFFSGYLTAHGVIKNRSGLVIRTFNAHIDANWREGIGTLVEDFTFNDGESQQRIWTLTPNRSGSYTGTAADVVGPGKMKLAGNSLFLDYVLRIPYGESTIDVRVDDRMYLVAPDVLINESVMKKFGVKVGSIDLVIVRHNRDRMAFQTRDNQRLQFFREVLPN